MFQQGGGDKEEAPCAMKYLLSASAFIALTNDSALL